MELKGYEENTESVELITWIEISIR